MNHSSILIPAFLGLLVSCSEEADSHSKAPGQTDAQPTVLTTFYPTQYFAQRIAQDAARVVCPIPDEADPSTWMPSAAVIQSYQRADLIVVNGANFESWIDKVTLPPSKIIETSKPFEASWVRYENAVVHRHGPGGDHSHEGIDGHTWLDPINAMAQAREIEQGLAARWPDRADVFANGFASLRRDLEKLDGRLRAFAAAWDGRAFTASHPAYNYLAKRYGLAIANLDLDPSRLPDEATLETAQAVAARYGAKHLLWEAWPAPEVALAMEGAGLKNVPFIPCETPPEVGDYLTAMRQNLDRLEALLSR